MAAGALSQLSSTVPDQCRRSKPHWTSPEQPDLSNEPDLPGYTTSLAAKDNESRRKRQRVSARAVEAEQRILAYNLILSYGTTVE